MKNIVSIAAICFCQILFGQDEDSILIILKSNEVSSIITDEEHKEFLINAYLVDQGIRETVLRTEEEFGFRSHEYDSVFYRWVDIDRYLFNTIVEYLEIHSHPKKELGETACSTPILIFHHVAGKPQDLDMKKQFFPIFYIAYKNESITSGEIWIYLYRLYGQIFKEQYSNSDIGEAQQIEELVELLELKRK
jgi:hypothetical protein